MTSVSKPFIFVSCGQYTEAEKSLGKAIVKMVKSITGLDAFFSEEVQDLNGLDSNILCALHDCAAFITVMHPRGRITRLDGSVHIRSSVWIEQEIAIATYIQRVEKRPLPVIAFIHESVGREGIRDLLHLNPIPFSDETQVIAALPERLAPWRLLTPSGIKLQLESIKSNIQDNHHIRRLEVNLVNDTSQRITTYDCQVRLPAAILKHWSSTFIIEVHSDVPGYRCFRFNEAQAGALKPRDKTRLVTFDYCMKCAVDDAGGIEAVVTGATVEARVWIHSREYTAEQTLMGLRQEADGRGEY